MLSTRIQLWIYLTNARNSQIKSVVFCPVKTWREKVWTLSHSPLKNIPAHYLKRFTVDLLHIWQLAFTIHQALKVQSISLVIASSENSYNQFAWKKKENVSPASLWSKAACCKMWMDTELCKTIKTDALTIYQVTNSNFMSAHVMCKTFGK